MTPEAFTQLARALPEPMLLVEGTGTVLAANPPASTLFGRPLIELAGVALSEIVEDPPDRINHYLSAFARSRDTYIGSIGRTTATNTL